MSSSYLSLQWRLFASSCDKLEIFDLLLEKSVLIPETRAQTYALSSPEATADRLKEESSSTPKKPPH
jgi:hypothetical protein